MYGNRTNKGYFEIINIIKNEIKIGIDKYFFWLKISWVNNNHDINNNQDIINVRNDIEKIIFGGLRVKYGISSNKKFLIVLIEKYLNNKNVVIE